MSSSHRRRRRAGLVGALVLPIVLAAAGCGGDDGGAASGGGDTSPIKVGLIQPITSIAALPAKHGINGAKFAVKQINDAGGLGGRKLELEVRDSQGKTTTGVSVAQTLIDDKVAAILGPNFSATALALLPKINQAQLPWMPAALAPDLTSQGSPWVFRIRPTTEAQFEALAEYVANELHAKSVAMIASTDELGQSASKVLKEQFAKLGVTIATAQTYVVNATDFTAQVKRMVDAHPDVALFSGFGEPAAATWVRQMREQGYTGQLVGGNNFADETVIKLVPDQLDGAIGVTNFIPATKPANVAKFVDDYKAEYGEEPDGYSAAFYDAVNLIASCWKSGDTSPEHTRDCLKEISGYQGVSINYTYKGGTGDPGTSEVITRYKDHKLSILAVTE